MQKGYLGELASLPSGTMLLVIRDMECILIYFNAFPTGEVLGFTPIMSNWLCKTEDESKVWFLCS